MHPGLEANAKVDALIDDRICGERAHQSQQPAKIPILSLISKWSYARVTAITQCLPAVVAI